jgi:hypothetical protein
MKLLRVSVPCMAVVLATACGGGSMTYDVSARATGLNRTIYPTTATVSAGGTTTPTLVPNSGYAVSGVTGCGGSLSGDIYTNLWLFGGQGVDSANT